MERGTSLKRYKLENEFIDLPADVQPIIQECDSSNDAHRVASMVWQRKLKEIEEEHKRQTGTVSIHFVPQSDTLLTVK